MERKTVDQERTRKLLGIASAERLRQREQALRLVRQFFFDRGFLEVDAPVLVPVCGMEPHIAAVETHVSLQAGPRANKRRAYLHTSPEYAMKKMLGAGFEKLFALTRVFRDGEITERHQIEFSMLEFYDIESDVDALMGLTESLVRHCAAAFALTELDGVAVAQPFKRWRVRDALLECSGVDLDRVPIGDAAAFAEQARKAGVSIPAGEPFDDVFNRLFLERVEPRLRGPVYLYDYPVELAVLARKRATNPRYAERFELFIGTLELCNGFGELTDPNEQRARFVAEQDERQALGLAVPEIDEDLLLALSTMPACSGNAIGFDRLVMVLCGAKTISEVCTFTSERLFSLGVKM